MHVFAASTVGIALARDIVGWIHVGNNEWPVRQSDERTLYLHIP